MGQVHGWYENEATQELGCQNLNGLNDQVSSVRIVKDMIAVGYWQAITSTESQEYEFHIGINYE